MRSRCTLSRSSLTTQHAGVVRLPCLAVNYIARRQKCVWWASLPRSSCVDPGWKRSMCVQQQEIKPAAFKPLFVKWNHFYVGELMKSPCFGSGLENKETDLKFRAWMVTIKPPMGISLLLPLEFRSPEVRLMLSLSINVWRASPFLSTPP